MIGKEAGVQGYMGGREPECIQAEKRAVGGGGRGCQAGSLLQNKSNLVYLYKSNLG